MTQQQGAERREAVAKRFCVIVSDSLYFMRFSLREWKNSAQSEQYCYGFIDYSTM